MNPSLDDDPSSCEGEEGPSSVQQQQQHDDLEEVTLRRRRSRRRRRRPVQQQQQQLPSYAVPRKSGLRWRSPLASGGMTTADGSLNRRRTVSLAAPDLVEGEEDLFSREGSETACSSPFRSVSLIVITGNTSICCTTS